MAYTIQESTVGWTAIANKDLTARHALGVIVRAADPTYGSGEFIYLKGVASCVLGSWVSINRDAGDVTLLAANARSSVGVAMAATTASYYGWFQISGKAVGKCLTSFADNGRVYITGTAGSVDDASVAGDVVYNATGASTTTVNSFIADFEIDRPYCADRVSVIS